MQNLFEELEILETTKSAIRALGLETLTPIQALTIPVMLAGKDFIGQAQTGTGKTFAFAIPIIEKINPDKRHTQALVLCPTRELSLQVYNEFLKLVKLNSKITVVPIVGGESYERQFKALKRNPHVVIGTPGRILDHIERKTLNLENLAILTFDEADEMLKMGFKDDLESILKDAPEERQTVLFSATIPNEIKRIAQSYQKNSEIIKDERKELTVDKVSQNYFLVRKSDKLKLLKRVLDLEMIESAIVFANTKKEVDEICEILRKEGYSADALHGDLKQSQRNYVTNLFRSKELKVLVATDVAARGLDISNVEVVINYELPTENEVYVHRIGRTGRAGNSGKAYSFVTPRTEYKVRELERFVNAKIGKNEIPSTKKIKVKRMKKFVDDLVVGATTNEKSYAEILKNLDERGVSVEQIVNYYLAKEIPLESVYDEIEMIKDKPARQENKTSPKNNNQEPRANKTNSRVSKANSSMYKINLGRKDKITPVALLEILRFKFQIQSKYVGDIKHFDKYTTFELSNRAAAVLGDAQSFKHRNNNVKIEII